MNAATENTDTLLIQREGFAVSLTQDDGIAIEVGGTVVVRTAAAWHRLARNTEVRCDLLELRATALDAAQEALEQLLNSVAAALQRHGVSHADDPGEAIDVLVQRMQFDLSDMEQRKDAAYLERNQVVAALAKAFPSGIVRTAIEGWSEDSHGCVYIDLPTGQASWHFHDSHAHLFAGLPAYTKPWDGHDTPEKYRRLAALSPWPQFAYATEGTRLDLDQMLSALIGAVYNACEKSIEDDAPLPAPDDVGIEECKAIQRWAFTQAVWLQRSVEMETLARAELTRIDAVLPRWSGSTAARVEAFIAQTQPEEEHPCWRAARDDLLDELEDARLEAMKHHGTLASTFSKAIDWITGERESEG